MHARVVLGVGKGVLFREVSSVQECPHRERGSYTYTLTLSILIIHEITCRVKQSCPESMLVWNQDTVEFRKCHFLQKRPQKYGSEKYESYKLKKSGKKFTSILCYFLHLLNAECVTIVPRPLQLLSNLSCIT